MVLPEPDGPISTVTVPGARCNPSRNSTGVSSIIVVTSVKSTAGPRGGLPPDTGPVIAPVDAPGLRRLVSRPW